jgi:hypothetical protein
LLDEGQSAGGATTAVLVALSDGRGVGGARHARLAADVDAWAGATADPYLHAHWLGPSSGG